MFNRLIINNFTCRYITNNIKWINMDKQLKRKDLVLVKWNSKYMTDREGCSLSEGVRYLDRDIETSTVGYFIEEDDKAIVLTAINKDGGAFIYISKRLKKDPHVLWMEEHADHIYDADKSYILDIFMKYPDEFVKPDSVINELIRGSDYPYLMLANYIVSKHRSIKYDEPLLENITF